MAYSRWSKTSIWYTFWSALCSPSTDFKLPTKKLRDDQCFEICDFPSYHVTYGTLKKDGIKKVIKDIQEYYKQNGKKTQLSDYNKLRWDLIYFMDDIEKDFKWWNFFYMNWYIQIRNRIIWWYRDNFKRKRASI